MQTKLDKNNVEDIIPLTPMQEGMLFHYRMEPKSLEYHEQISINLVGNINSDFMQKAWDFVIEKNEMLRTVYRWKSIDKPVQMVLKNHKVVIQHYDISEKEAVEKEKFLNEVKQADLQNRIDLEKETLRIALCKCSERDYTMIISNHHILYDGWSSGIIIKELINAYDALSKGLEPIAPFKSKFSEYVKWMDSLDKRKQKAYWERHLHGIEQNDDLFSKAMSSEIRSYEYILPKDVSNQLAEFAKENSISVASLLYTVWGILIQKLNNTHDVMFGITVSGRDSEIRGIEKMVGLFINTIPLRIQSDKEETLIQLLQKINQIMKESHEFESTPLVDINEYAGLSNQSQLFNSLVVIENYPLNVDDYQDGLLKINEYSAIERTNYNLTLGIMIQESIKLNFGYNCFSDDQMIVRIGQYFETIICAILTDKNSKINDIDILSKAERNKVLYEFNDTYADYPREKTIHQLFEEQVERTPDNVALVFNDEQITYSELNKKSNQVARILRANGVKSDDIIGIMAVRSSLIIIGILGILKSGGAYLPIDSDYPEERIKFMLEDSKAEILLTQSWLSEVVEFEGMTINLDELEGYQKEVGNLEVVNHSTDLAYVIYTSGSTGMPKGVMIEHRSVVNFCHHVHTQPLVTELKNRCEYIYASNGIVFDITVQEIFLPLLNGIGIVMAKDLVAFHQVNQENLGFISTPSKFSNYLLQPEFREKLKDINVIMLGAEEFKIDLLNHTHINKSSIIFNGYGPTEATCGVLYYKMKTETKNSMTTVPIGKPISNTKIYIVDREDNPVPLGISGELCIGGEGLARGYLNRPELTMEKFIENPFVSGERMYLTGDLARWSPDGNIEYLGRIDDQVKIRGFRIELGEIESQLLKLDRMKEVVVVAREDKAKDSYLCGYYVSDGEQSVSELRQYLSEHLPDYMIPSYFVQLEKLPLTPNGKLDRKALPEPVGGVETAYVAPRNETEEILAHIWSEVLGRERIGIHDNFFELGGHSLRATVIVSRIHKELSMELPLKALFKTPTISGISDYLSQATESEYATIEPVAEKEYYETSSAQKRMWLLQQFDWESIGYNMPGVLMIEGELDRDRVEHVFLDLMNRHEVLRTSFEMIEDVTVQKIAENVAFEIKYTEPAEEQIEEVIRDFVRPFDLSQAPLLRVGLISINETCHYLMFDMHHIISDGVSMSILTKEFMMLYDGQELEKQRIQYKDFSEWQNDYLKSDKMKEQEKYWLDQFSDELPILDLPLDYVRSSTQSYEGGSISFSLGSKLTAKLNELAHQQDATLYMVLLSAINILLSKYTGQADILIGNPIAGRPHVDLENMLGIFVNTLVIRNHPEGKKCYQDFLEEVKESALNAYENQDYQFEELIAQLDLHRDVSRNPLFDVMFVLQNMEATALEIEGLKLSPYTSSITPTKFDLTFTAIEVKDEISFNIAYSKSLFKHETIKRLMGHFQNVLISITSNRRIKIESIDILSPTERHQLLYEFNDTYAAYPRDKTIHQLFEEQVEKTPDKVALMFNKENITYKELNGKANQVARLLREKGVNTASIIGIMMEHSSLMLIGILGVLKAGGTYLPIDPNYPAERVNYMLEDSKSGLLLTNLDVNVNTEFIEEIINLKHKDLNLYNKENLIHINRIDALVYIIYTSGSTGKPKGVMIRHRNLANYVSWARKIYFKNEDEVIALYSSIAFDLTVTSIFTPLITGNKMLIYDNNEKEFILHQILKEGKATIIKLTPAHLTLLKNIDKGNYSVKRLIVGGDDLSVDLAREVSNKMEGIEIYNEYGPTEATVGCMIYKYDEKKDIVFSLPIGRSIDNTQTYILDNHLNVMPTGVVGELCVGGDGLAHGYLNQPELTSEKFIENPFIEGAQIYRTGDLARWLPDGNVEFLGRIDHQVKLRGFRIELGEIESQILKFDEVKEAVVLARVDETKDKYLCAYYVSSEEISMSELRQHLSAALPDYMIPSYFMWLEKFPLTSNGKLDRKALPNPGGKVAAEYVAPRNRTEETLAIIWSEVLDKDRVGIDDNFFELGGHSLKATVMISKIHKELTVEIPLKELFQTPTISGISDYLANVKESEYATIEPVEEKEYYEASSAQKRMWLLQQLDHTSIAYNTPGVLILDGNLDKRRLYDVFSKLVERHELLRTSFSTVDDVIVQRINKNIGFEIENAMSSSECIEEDIRAFIRPFDLSKGPLLRVVLIKRSENQHYLFFDLHHIISDGVSISILAKELMALYNGQELEEQHIQYRDFSAWQNEYLKSEKMQKQEKYWLEQFSDEIPRLNLPLDCTRSLLQNFEDGNVVFRLNHKLTEKLNILAQATGATLYMILLSTIHILLSKYTNQEDIIVGSPIAGRPHADLEGIIGMFVNTLAMRNDLKSNKTYVAFLKEVKETALAAYENQDYQFEELVDKLNLHRDLNRNPLFDVMFILQNMKIQELELEGLRLTEYRVESVRAKFDLTFTAIEVENEIQFNIEYRANLFKRETIERMAKHLQNLVEVVVADKEILLKDIDILSNDERNKLLYEFNHTDATYPKEKMIHQLFEERVFQNPDKIALIYEGQNMSYGELNDKANKLATILRAKGVERDVIVGILVERSFEAIIGILGVLKAGGAYLPIDPEYPKDRIQFMLDDSQLSILLTQSWQREKIVTFTKECLWLDDEALYEGVSENLENINLPSDLAYVIYTSGSTGMPKGVKTIHQGMHNHILAKIEVLKMTEKSVVAQNGPLVFVVSVWQCLAALTIGGIVAIYSSEISKDAKKLLNSTERDGVTILEVVPSLLRHIAELQEQYGRKFKGLKQLISTGEPLSAKLANRVIALNPEIEIVNTYGQTEGSDDYTHYLMTAQEEREYILAGKPIRNMRIYILDKNNNIQPIGVPGELCVSGDGVARGYLNRPELTLQKFVENPIVSGVRMYCSGDLARWLPDGNIECLGRIDHQVKVRGFRIELGEIENRLLGIESVKEGVVIARTDESGENYLCAYIVSEEVIQTNDLRRQLSETLPNYMIPSYFVHLEKMPLLTNGKIERKALPIPDMVSEIEYVAPRNRTEEILAHIWCEVLDLKKVGIYDNFFELGGHSLKAVMAINKMNDELGITIPLAELYTNPCISGIGEYVGSTKENEFEQVDGLLLLKKGKQSDKNFFMVHAGHGKGAAYTKLTHHLNNKFSYWGINYENPTSYDPCVMPMEKLAAKYIEKIKRIQEKGTYYLSGWCIGGVIAFEMAKQLEATGDEVKFVGLYNSPIMDGISSKLFTGKEFTVKAECNLIGKLFLKHKFSEKYKNIESVEKLWAQVVKGLEDLEIIDEKVKEEVYKQICLASPLVGKVVKDYTAASIGEMIHYFNLLRGLDNSHYQYKIEGKINAKISYFVAIREKNRNRRLWRKRSSKRVDYYQIDADHFSMFEDDEDVKKLAFALTKILDNLD